MMLVGLAIASGEKLVFDKLFTGFYFYIKIYCLARLAGRVDFFG